MTTEVAASAPHAAQGGPVRRTGWVVRALTVLLFAGYAIYAAAFIFHTSFVIDGVRYFCLFDDGMISMRYAKNLAHGYGLVWNPGGERVEGFTNPLWVVYMALWHLLPISPAKMSLPIQISSGVLLLGALYFVWRIAKQVSGGSDFAALAAVALTGLYLPLLNWSLQGMEVGALALLVAAAAHLLLRDLARERFSLLPYLMLGVAMLVRFDALVMVAAMLLFGVWWDRRHWKQHLLVGIGTLALFGGGETLFRLLYYGEPFPNTYYLKMTGFPTSLRVLRGAYYYYDFLAALPTWLLAPAFLPLIVRRTKGHMLLATLVLAQSAYSIWVGGDAWEWWGGSNRYLSIAMPMFFLLVALGITETIRAFSAKLRPAAYAVGVLVVLVGVVMSNMCGPTTLREWLFQAPPLHRAANQFNIRTAALLRAVTTDRALIGVTWAGSQPYFDDRNAHDMLGKCDRHIAHGNVHLMMNWGMAGGFIPGHLKYDFAYTVLQVQPDLLMRDVSRGPKEKGAFLQRYKSYLLGRHEVFAKLGSPNIRWDLLRRLDAAEKQRREQPADSVDPYAGAPEGALP